MKTLKFKSNLVPLILGGTKTVTWRMFDDKDLTIGDALEFVNSDTGMIFAHAHITEIKEKKLGEINDTDFAEGHERYKNRHDMVVDYRSYYGAGVTLNSMIKLVHFSLKS